MVFNPLTPSHPLLTNNPPPPHTGGGSDSSSCSPQAGGDDGEVEASLDTSNKVYTVQGCALVPHETAWGTAPTVDLLQSHQVGAGGVGGGVGLG